LSTKKLAIAVYVDIAVHCRSIESCGQI